MRALVARMRFRLDHRWAPDHMSAHLDGELAGPQRARMVRHLGACVECRGMFGSLTAVVEALHRLPAQQDAPDPARLAASVRVRLDERPFR
jgi:anti-sigma factor RsiW